MKELTIGNLIEYQIKKKSVSIDKLVEGLCSTTSLKRLINGDTRQSFFLVERILERLGVSVNKVSLLHNENDDRLFIMREMISKLLADRAYTKAEFILTEYKEIADLSNPLQLQYVIEAEGVIQLECYEKHEEALEMFNKAQKIILGKFEMDKLHEFVLGEEEIILLMLILNEEMKVKNKNISIYARQLLDYVEKQFEDEEVKTNIYSKLAWIMGESAIRNKKYEDALEFTLNGIDALTDNGLLLHLPQFLDRLLFLTKDRDENMYRSWKKKRDALKELYLEYNEPWETEDIRLWESYRQNSVYLISEFLKDERDLAEYTQEELAEAVGIDIKTISRIENGKSTPKKGTFTSIKEHFDIEIESFQTRLTVDNLSLLEMERDISRLSSKHRYEEAESLFKSLKKQLSMESRINRQYVAFMEELFDNVFKRKPTEEVLANLEKAFLRSDNFILFDNSYEEPKLSLEYNKDRNSIYLSTDEKWVVNIAKKLSQKHDIQMISITEEQKNKLDELLAKLSIEQIKKDHPTISDNNAKVIELFINTQLAKYHDKPNAQQAILEKIQSQLPDIASGKISLPDLPNQDKGKGR